MKKTSTLIRNAVAVARVAQMCYNSIGAAATQNIRNPWPMNQLVLGALPKSPKRAKTVEEVMETLRAAGYIARRQTVAMALSTGVRLGIHSFRTHRASLTFNPNRQQTRRFTSCKRYFYGRVSS